MPSPPKIAGASLRRRRGVRRLAFGARQLGVHLVDRVAHRRREVRIVAQRRRGAARALASAAAPSRSFGVILRTSLEREATVDHLERFGIDRGRERLAGVGEIGADLGQRARRARRSARGTGRASPLDEER